MDYKEALEFVRKGEKVYVRLAEDKWFQMPHLGEHNEVRLSKGTMGRFVDAGSDDHGPYVNAIFNFGYSIIDYIGPMQAECYPHDLEYLAACEVPEEKRQSIDKFCQKVMG